jgi:hypothetical protein
MKTILEIVLWYYYIIFLFIIIFIIIYKIWLWDINTHDKPDTAQLDITLQLQKIPNAIPLKQKVTPTVPIIIKIIIILNPKKFCLLNLTIQLP